LPNWGFLTNHAHVLIWVTQHPHSTVRQIALATGLTERATVGILQDIRREGIIIADSHHSAPKMFELINAPSREKNVSVESR